MSVSMKEVDPAFQGAGQKAGIEVWRIENSSPVAVSESSYGKFFTGETYMILKTNGSKSGSFRHDIHYWIGKDASEDEASTAAVKPLELDAALGGRSVQYRELQGYETERFLSCFRPCIIPEESEHEEHKTRMFLCKGKHVVHVPCARSSLNHDSICILDSKSKIFQFNGLNTSIQERAKALEVVQYIRDTYHRSKCDIATIDDGKLMADAEAGEFWGFFGGFAPLPKKTTVIETQSTDTHPTQLFCVKKGQAEHVAADSLTKKLLDTHVCYLLDCGAEIYVWMGRSTSLEERKDANRAAEEYLRDQERPTSKIIRMIENFETVSFRSKFASWPKPGDVVASEEGRGKVAALLKRQGLDVKGLVKAAPPKEEEEDPQAYIDCSGTLQVWRVNGQEKNLLSEADQSKFYTGDCYIFQYTYSGDNQEECLIGTWFGKKSVTEDRDSAISQANKMVESFKFLATQALIYEGNEPIMFYAIFQSFMVLKGGLSNGYKNYISENGLEDDTYKEDGVALFRVQGSGPENMQSIQVESSASSLNSCYCYILHKDSLIFTWYGNQTNADDQDLAERQLDVIKPDMQTRVHKEGSESDQFWELLGGKKKHLAQKIPREAESDPHLFSCTLSKGEDLTVCEIHNFNQDDLMTEDVYILDCHTDIFLWVGQEVPSKTKTQALAIGQKFLERDVLIEYLSLQTPIYIIMEGSEPPFFTRFFKWDSKKFAVHGNSFQRKLSILKGGRSTMNLKPKKRAPVSFGGRSGSEKPQRSRSVTLSSDRPRARGRSPAFNAIASKFDSPGGRNLSTPPPQLYPKASGASEGGSGSGGGNVDASKLFTKSKAIASITASFDKPTLEKLMPRSLKASSNSTTKSESNSKFNPHTIKEDAKEDEVEDEEGVTLYPFDRLTTSSMDPAPDIDVTRREIYLSKTDFREKFGMTKEAFYKLPRWRQNKIKISLKLF
ncbi:villin/Gelsolin, ADF-H/Gelsolin-like domain protein [Artemisia annua]|uniref:Villin/Gelsolin, ADF-H/Gelsolin-like domain protein n=1 Tax=Artemisia annua TaxID=35608 RepID=A0A2U1N8Q5_ARTAN|nr:villin/Gelsolin, ADF-H/Gelsolin-like domain protein [Artemisia annua]